jgi:hypothetical protein
LQSRKESSHSVPSSDPSADSIAVETEPISAPPKAEPTTTVETSTKSIPSLEEMKKEILKALRQDRHSLAAAMEKSRHWNFENPNLSLSFDSPFESTFIEKESREIEHIIKEQLGWEVSIKTLINQSEDLSVDEEIEEQVELVRNIFRGTIINRSSV